MEQLRLDLFPKADINHKGEWRRWLKMVRFVNSEGLRVFDELIAALGWYEATERSKALDTVYGREPIEGLTVDDLGLFTAKDYHTCWDRAWAARHGFTPEQVREITYWDYAKGEPSR